ncbi:MAG: VacJ family lipoprotein [Arenicellales bacterium]
MKKIKVVVGIQQCFKQLRVVLLMVVLGAMLGGCSSLQKQKFEMMSDTIKAELEQKNSDPFEKMNRSVYKFNDGLDKAILKPVAEAYAGHIPQTVRRSVANFFSNLWEPNTAINAFLQGRPEIAVESLARFLVNSTIGMLGLFDVASPMGVPHHDEDFGQTLAVWGMGNGPYIMLPFFGPSNLRDVGGKIVQYATTDLVSPLFDDEAQLFASGLRLLDQRAHLLGADETLAMQVDPYLFLRESYRQSRLVKIHNGVLPAMEEDPFEDDLFSE